MKKGVTFFKTYLRGLREYCGAIFYQGDSGPSGRSNI